MAGRRNRPNAILNKQVVKPDTTKLDSEGKEILAMLTALEDEAQLNNWEMGFVSDIATRFYNGHVLSPGQYNKLKEVYRRYN
jgi:hypothetical protein